MGRFSARRPAVLLALSLAIACSPRPPLADLDPQAGLHVFVFSFDALRADALGAYGYERRTSPNLDAFAERAVVFDRWYANAPITTLSFASAFTGTNPIRSFVDWKLVAPETLASAFAAAGYETAAFLHNGHLAKARGFGRGFATYEVFTELGRGADADVVARATGWLRGRAGAERPVFAWIHLIDPHTPWEPHAGSSHLYDPGTGEPCAVSPHSFFVMEDPEELACARTLYDGEVFAADALFGSFLGELEALGLRGRSLVVVTADHGEELMEHGELQHGQVYEENLHVPMILSHPALQGGRRVATLASHVDLLPTLLSLAGVPGPVEVDGRDLRRQGGDADSLAAFSFSARRWEQASLRSGHDKLILECGKRVLAGERPPRQLFDLAADPEERVDLATRAPRRVDELERALGEFLGRDPCRTLAALHATGDGLRGIGKRARRQLEALGYLEP